MNHPLDPSLNILHLNENTLDHFFLPKNIALIGASEKEGSVGKTLLTNLIASTFGGKIFPINPNHASILGLKTYPSILDLPEKVDLVIIAIPAKLVPKVIEECVRVKVSAAIIISSGFKEIGKEGLELEKRIEEIATKGNLRIIGPNCLGIMNPNFGLNATFAADMALKGNIAFISQSGALCTAVLDWSLEEKIGFSAFVSIGSMLDVQWSDLINYFGNDPNTQSILIYMEHLSNARSFLSAAREVALTKPIILIRASRTKEAMKAAISHTGALSSTDEVFEAALKRVGVLRVNAIADLFDLAEILSKQPSPKGPNLSIITNAGGPAVIAVDALIQNGGKLAELTEKTLKELNRILPKEWSHNNPIDILGDASPKRYAETLKIIQDDVQTDGILIILTPQNMTDPTGVATEIKKISRGLNIPVLASWMGGVRVKEGCEVLAKESIPNFEYPDNACKTFAYMWHYSHSLSSLYEMPHADILEIEENDLKQKRKFIDTLINRATDENRYLLNEYESKKIIEAYNIPINPTFVAKNLDEAISLAQQIGFPVVLKIFSNTITHKKAVGGVKLNLTNVDDVRRAYLEIFDSVKKLGEGKFLGVTVQTMITLEDLFQGFEIILGSATDNIFGPILLFGSGGHLVEMLRDRALGLPPLNTSLAQRVMQETRIYQILKSKISEKNLELLSSIFVQLSNLIIDYPQIKEIDINPLFISNQMVAALDARILLHDKIENIVNLAIRPYPIQYVKHLHDPKISLRPIKPEDVPFMELFLDEFSNEVLFERFLKDLKINKELVKARLLQLCFKDYERELCIVAELNEKGKKEFLGMAKLSKQSNANNALFSLIVKDKWKNKNIGTNLISHLIEIAKNEKLHSIKSLILDDNQAMLHICSKLGFKLTPVLDSNKIIAEYFLKV